MKHKPSVKRFITRLFTGSAQVLPEWKRDFGSVAGQSRLLDGQNVLVTGAGRNIGRGIALEMAAHGAQVYFTDIIEERCRAVEQALASFGAQSRWWVSDVTNEKDNKAICDFFSREDIPIHVLVNNAGIPKGDPATEALDLSRWRRIFETNVFGPADLTERVSQMMIGKQIHGSIIFITSIHQWTVSLQPGYSASKGAIGILVKETAVALARHGIRVNGIAPGWVALDDDGRPHGHRYSMLTGTTVDPSYIGRTAVYLASDYFSACTTGTILTVDAGLSLFNHRVAQSNLY